MRFHAQTDAFENGRVLLTDEAPWLEDFIHELTTFPGSKYDDQVDSTTQALAWMRKPVPWTGFFEYCENENKRMRGELVSDVRLKFPKNFVGSICTIKGRTFNRWDGEIIEVTEEEAQYMYTMGFEKV